MTSIDVESKEKQASEKICPEAAVQTPSSMEDQYKSEILNKERSKRAKPLRSHDTGETVRVRKKTKEGVSTTVTCTIQDWKYDDGKGEWTYTLKERESGALFEDGAYIAEGRLR